MKTRSKVFLTLACAVMLVAASVMGTQAYLTDQDTVTNTFVVGKVDITLKESPIQYGQSGDITYGNPAEGTNNQYRLIPGKTYRKDPTVAVVEGSETCWLFVKMTTTENTDTYITYDSQLKENLGWTQGDGKKIPNTVWYRMVNASDTTRSWKLLGNDQITIDADAVDMDSMTTAAAAKLEYTAYAIQYEGFEGNAATAWATVSDAA